MSSTPKVHVFWDNSNIYHSATEALLNAGRPVSGVRIDFGNLLKLAIANRPLGSAFCVGSVPPEAEAVWNVLKKTTNIKPELFERGEASGKEQAVDQALQVQMLRRALDEPTPQIAVLLTGDGHGYEDGVGFHADLQRLRDRGWGVEVLSWDHSCARALKAWAAAEGCFVKLDNFIDSLTFTQGVTHVKGLDMRKRPTAKVVQAQAPASSQQEAS